MSSMHSDDFNREDAWTDLDRQIQSRLHDVAVPSGLAARLKQAVSTATEATSPEAAFVVACSQVATPEQSTSLAVGSAVKPSELEEGWVRRTAIVSALVAGLCGFAWLASYWTRPADPEWLASGCSMILEQVEQENVALWPKSTQSVAVELSRVQSQLVRVQILGERSLAGLKSQWQGTVYRLDAGDGRGLMLIKLMALPPVRGLNSRFEVIPTPSGGWSLVAMSIGKETYVLAGPCTERQIFQYIRRADLT